MNYKERATSGNSTARKLAVREVRLNDDMKLTSTSAATVACLVFQVLALPQTGDFSIRATAESKDTLRASRLPRVANNDPINTYSIRDGRFIDDTRSENSKAATASLEKRAPFGDFNVDIVLAEASVRHGFNTTLCILNLVSPAIPSLLSRHDSSPLRLAELS